MIGWIMALVMFVLSLIVVIQSIRKPTRRRPKFDPYTQQGLQDYSSEDYLPKCECTEEYYELDNKRYDFNLDRKSGKNN